MRAGGRADAAAARARRVPGLPRHRAGPARSGRTAGFRPITGGAGPGPPGPRGAVHAPVVLKGPRGRLCQGSSRKGGT